MGAWRFLRDAAALAALLCASRAAAGTVVEPIARLSLEGGYDSNPLYDGRGSDQTGRVSPEVGLRLRSPRWDVRATYGGELVYFRQLAPEGLWNHRAGLAVDARPTHRTAVGATLSVSQAFDPAGLAAAGVFRSGRQDALIVNGRGRLDWRATRRVDAALTVTERTVRFADETGGAMHQPGVEALWRVGRRVSFGAAYAFGVFQGLERTAADEVAFSHAMRARARWRPSRHALVDASVGPALWIPDDRSSEGSSLVPEGRVDLLYFTRGIDLRAAAGHGLGIGATARPGLVDTLELGAERRFGRRYVLRGDAGLWRSGTIPDGGDSVTGYAVGGEAGILFGAVRVSVAGAHLGRTDDPSAEFRRTTIGLRMGWEMPVR